KTEGMTRLLAFIMFLTAAFPAVAQEIHIVPQPVKVSTPASKGRFVVDGRTKIVISDPGAQKAADFLRSYVSRYYGLELAITVDRSATNRILLGAGNNTAPVEGAYTMSVNKKGVAISGRDEAGAFFLFTDIVYAPSTGAVLL